MNFTMKKSDMFFSTFILYASTDDFKILRRYWRLRLASC